MSELTDLQAQVVATTGVEASAITFIQGLTAQLAAAIASGNTAALVQLTSDLSTSSAALAAAIATPPVANT